MPKWEQQSPNWIRLPGEPAAFVYTKPVSWLPNKGRFLWTYGRQHGHADTLEGAKEIVEACRASEDKP